MSKNKSVLFPLPEPQPFDPKKLTLSLTRDARALGLPMGAAEVFIAHTVNATKRALGTSKPVTEAEINRVVIKELKKYNPDLTYLYQYRNKII